MSIKIGLPCEIIADITSTILQQENIADYIFGSILGHENKDIANENIGLIDVNNIQELLLEICDNSDFNQQIDVESIQDELPVNINQIVDEINPYYIKLEIDNRAGTHVNICWQDHMC